jgi:hypothetical protein
MKRVAINMRLYGAFRSYGPSAAFSVPAGSSVTDIKNALAALLGPQARALIMDSVVANTDTILPGDYIVGGDEKLSILPPVCGG